MEIPPPPAHKAGAPAPHRSDPRPQSSAACSPVAGAHLSPAMPGRAADRGQVPLCSAAAAEEESRAGAEGSAGGGGAPERQPIVWRNVVLMSLLHLAAAYSLVLIPKAQPLTLLWGKSRGRPRSPLPAGGGGEAAPGRAGSRVRCCPGCGAPLCSPSPALGAPGPVACSCPSRSSFCPGISNFCLPGGPPVGASLRSPQESARGPEEARAGSRGTRRAPLSTGRRTGGPEVSSERVPGALLSAAFRLLRVLRWPRASGPSYG